MRKLACLFALALCGCGTVAPGVEVTTLYTPPMFEQIGTVRRVEDKENGVIIYFSLGRGGDVRLHSVDRATGNGK
jgi:hypothetical protein